jgi:hypothetical protein
MGHSIARSGGRDPTPSSGTRRALTRLSRPASRGAPAFWESRLADGLFAPGKLWPVGDLRQLSSASKASFLGASTAQNAT